LLKRQKHQWRRQRRQQRRRRAGADLALLRSLLCSPRRGPCTFESLREGKITFFCSESATERVSGAEEEEEEEEEEEKQ